MSLLNFGESVRLRHGCESPEMHVPLVRKCCSWVSQNLYSFVLFSTPTPTDIWATQRSTAKHGPSRQLLSAVCTEPPASVPSHSVAEVEFATHGHGRGGGPKPCVRISKPKVQRISNVCYSALINSWLAICSRSVGPVAPNGMPTRARRRGTRLPDGQTLGLSSAQWCPAALRVYLVEFETLRKLSRWGSNLMLSFLSVGLRLLSGQVSLLKSLTKQSMNVW